MLVWIDILTPKQVFFLGELGRRLEDRGHNVFRTTRKYREVDELLKLKDVSAVVIGKHGGATLEGKLAASAQRVEGLSHVISRLKPDLSIAFASPEAARTAFGLGIPHYTTNDSPHAVAVARLTVPLASRLFSPRIIPKSAWLRFGIGRNRVVQYNALDPIAWLRTSTPNPAVLRDLNLDPSRPIVVFRAEEAFASYLLGRVSERESVIIPIVNRVKEMCAKQTQIVALPRYTEQIPAVKMALQNRVIVPESVVDGPSLMFFASVFIGAGGTMTAEAALLGTPTVSCYPTEATLVERYLIREKLVTRITNPERAARKIAQILEDFENVHRTQMARAKALTSQMEDPIEVIMKTIEDNFPA